MVDDQQVGQLANPAEPGSKVFQVLVAGKPGGIVDHHVAELHGAVPAAEQRQEVDFKNCQLAGRYIGVFVGLDAGVELIPGRPCLFDGHAVPLPGHIIVLVLRHVKPGDGLQRHTAVGAKIRGQCAPVPAHRLSCAHLGEIHGAETLLAGKEEGWRNGVAS